MTCMCSCSVQLRVTYDGAAVAGGERLSVVQTAAKPQVAFEGPEPNGTSFRAHALACSSYSDGIISRPAQRFTPSCWSTRMRRTPRSRRSAAGCTGWWLTFQVGRTRQRAAR